MRRAVDRRLEHVAVSTAEAVRQAKIGAAAGEGEADHRVGRGAVVEAGCETERARRPVMGSGQWIAGGVALAAISCGPYAPTLRIDHPACGGSLVDCLLYTSDAADE